MASIQKRGTGWRAQVRRAGFPSQSATFDTKRDAEAWSREIERSMDRGIYVDLREAQIITLAEALERYGREVVPAKGQRQRELNRVRQLQTFPIARKALGAIRGADMAAFRDWRASGGAGPNTIRLDLALISNVYVTASREWGMEGLPNPVASIRKPRVPAGRERRVRPGELGAIMAVADMTLSCMAVFAVATAMRRGEIAGLRWADVDLRRCTARLTKTKNGDVRTVPLSPIAAEALSLLPSASQERDGLVFGMSSNAITIAWRRACARSGVQGLTFHDLRHEGASRLFEDTDLDVMEIRLITGHRTLQMLARYTHLRADRLVERLAGRPRVAA